MKIKIIIALFIVLTSGLFSQNGYIKKFNKLSLTENLAFNTIRLEVQTTSKIITGTAFFFNLFRKDSLTFPVIVTNKHMVDDAVIGKFFLNESKGDGVPHVGSFKSVVISNFKKYWFFHPDSSVDLAIMPIAPLLTQSEEEGFKIFFQPIDETLIPDSDAVNSFTAVEDILMIGYPSGIWDSKNNYPIFRKGITATHPALNYENRSEFMIDCACYPGSSGSPVFLYKSGAFLGGEGDILFGEKIFFLRVLYAGPQFTSIGKLEIRTIPEKNDTVSISRIPNNLGNVIKSSELKEFKKFFKVEP